MAADSLTQAVAALKAPSLEAMDAMTRQAFAELPLAFRALCGDVIIHVTDFPSDEVLAEMEAETPFDLLGLFTGIGLAQGASVAETGQLPNTVHLYRRPILDYWAEHDETLGAIVTHVLIHEIGHHFGLSDQDMDAIENRAG
jgi:predicted Zn-dependent protease with MMP-like domain